MNSNEYQILKDFAPLITSIIFGGFMACFAYVQLKIAKQNNRIYFSKDYYYEVFSLIDKASTTNDITILKELRGKLNRTRFLGFAFLPKQITDKIYLVEQTIEEKIERIELFGKHPNEKLKISIDDSICVFCKLRLEILFIFREYLLLHFEKEPRIKKNDYYEGEKCAKKFIKN